MDVVHVEVCSIFVIVIFAGRTSRVPLKATRKHIRCKKLLEPEERSPHKSKVATLFWWDQRPCFVLRAARGTGLPLQAHFSS